MQNESALPAHSDLELPHSSADEIIIRYRPLVEIEKWLAQRVEDRSDGKTFYVILVSVVFMMTLFQLVSYVLNNVEGWLQNLAGWSALLTGGAGAGLAGGSNTILLLYSFLVCTGIGIIATTFYNAMPTHLLLSREGIKLLWRHNLYYRDGLLISWGEIFGLSLEESKGKTSPLDRILRFSFGDNKSLRLRLGCIPSPEERAKLLEAVTLWAPELDRDAAAVQALELPPDYSYTELWLQALSGPPRRERLTPLVSGTVLRDARYSVDRQLGVGGQGTAYLAYDRELAEMIVLKEFILPVFVDVSVRRQSLESFEKEARILRQLDHSQIVRLIDFFVEDHRGYLVLEHIDGNSLRELVLESGAMSEESAVNLALQMCRILSYLHDLKPPVVHRDFTPDNLILRKDGTLKLVDFNVAQQKESTATGTVVGKHAYLPPEQFRGHPTPQSDLYSMGASLHFMLTAQEPEPISRQFPRRIKSELSESINQIVSKATSVHLKDRYASVAEIEHDLLALLAVDK